MIRDFDEFGAQPLRGPGCFRRPKVDEDYLHDFGLYGGEVRQRVINAEFAFYERSMRAGLRMIWAELERVESHHILSQAYMIAYHLRVLSCYGPVERSIRFARRSLRFLPDRGKDSELRAVALGELANLYLRQGNRRGAWRCCEEILRMEQAGPVYGAVVTAWLHRSQLMQLDGDLSKALEEAEKAATPAREGKLAWLPKTRFVALQLGNIREAVGRRQEAHEAYRWATEVISERSFATRADHQAAWDGFHRTK